MTPVHLHLSPFELRLLQGAALVLLVLKLAQIALGHVFMDEAYYWLWGRHPALSYYDHPPLNAWLLGLSGALFGWNQLGLRAPVVLTLAGDVLALFLLARRLGGSAATPWFWVSLVLFLTIPAFWLTSIVAIPDHVLVCCSLFSLYFFVGFVGERQAGRPGRSVDLLAGALFLGLALLAKYNAAFIGAGLVLYAVLADRALLREWRVYAAMALALLLQAPVIVWNLTSAFASWEFILHGRHAGLRTGWAGAVQWLWMTLVFVSPLLLWWPALLLATGRGEQRPGKGAARAIFLVSTLVIIAVSLVTPILFHWNIVAYVALLPFLAGLIGSRWVLVGQVAYGALFAVLVFVNYTVTPLAGAAPLRDHSTVWSYGWDEVAAAVRMARADHTVGFVATPDYTTASLLAFALRDRDVTSLNPAREAFDDWFDSAAQRGSDALLVADRLHPLDGEVRALFQSVTELAQVEIAPGGAVINRFTIYLGRSYAPQ